MAGTRRTLVGLLDRQRFLAISVWAGDAVERLHLRGPAPRRLAELGIVGQTISRPASVSATSPARRSPRPTLCSVPPPSTSIPPAPIRARSTVPAAALLSPTSTTSRRLRRPADSARKRHPVRATQRRSEAAPGRWRFVPPGSEGHTVLLPTGETCMVQLRLPSSSGILRSTSPPGTPGIQTFPIASPVPASTAPPWFLASATPATASAPFSRSTPTHRRLRPSSTASLGSSIKDTATVTGAPVPAAEPTGTVSFTAFGPERLHLCRPRLLLQRPQARWPADLRRPPPPATSSRPRSATYRWVATYNGDANYDPVTGSCNDANETSVVDPAVATITTIATPSVTIGSPITDVATVTGARRRPAAAHRHRHLHPLRPRQPHLHRRPDLHQRGRR